MASQVSVLRLHLATLQPTYAAGKVKVLTALPCLPFPTLLPVLSVLRPVPLPAEVSPSLLSI